jgi:hypothetical protein
MKIVIRQRHCYISGKQLDGEGIYPDASLSQAESFYAEAQVRIYERLLRDAEDGFRNLVIPDTLYDIYYKMAASKRRFSDLKAPEERERDWKRYLDLILEEDPFFQNLANPNAQGAMNISLYTLETLQDRSGEILGDIDRVLFLYEGGNPLVIPAHEIYAQYYLDEEQLPHGHEPFPLCHSQRLYGGTGRVQNKEPRFFLYRISRLLGAAR